VAGKRRLKSSGAPPPAKPAPAKAPPAKPAAKRARRGARKGRAGYVVAVLALALGAAAVAAVGAYLLTPHPGAGRAVRVVIPEGVGAAGVTRALWDARVIEHPWLFHALVAVTGTASRTRRGTLALRDDLTPRAVLRALRSGSAGVLRVTIPEAWTRFDIARRLEGAGVCSAESFLAHTEDPAVLARYGVPAVPGVPASLEGWLFPDTYDFAPDAGAEAVVARMTQVLGRRLDAVKAANPAGVLRAAALVSALPAELRGVSPGGGVAADPVDRALLTLASLVERETGAPEDRAHIASVFWNRLSRNDFVPRLLQSDPTVVFGCRVMLRAGAPDAGGACAGVEGARPTITSAMLTDGTNPWNTYRHEALPPSPICNPGARALEAALAPSPDEDLYFVARGDGRSVFARTLEEHRRNVQTWLRRGPRDGGSAP
jgi:UPF0755 protein